jgi:uncharacterized OsmC-like protein
VRQIPAAGNLSANVEGDIEEQDGVLRITSIRVVFQLKIPRGMRDKVARVLQSYADKCPAYQSVKNCIHVTWEADVEEC